MINSMELSPVLKNKHLVPQIRSFLGSFRKRHNLRLCIPPWPFWQRDAEHLAGGYGCGGRSHGSFAGCRYVLLCQGAVVAVVNVGE